MDNQTDSVVAFHPIKSCALCSVNIKNTVYLIGWYADIDTYLKNLTYSILHPEPKPDPEFLHFWVKQTTYFLNWTEGIWDQTAE